MTGDDLLGAVQTLIDLDRRERVQEAVGLLPDDLPVAALLRAADGAQQLARALAERRRGTAAPEQHEPGYDPHDVRSLYS